MEYSEMRRQIDQSVEFPITYDSLLEQLGDVEITSPTGGSVPVSEILTRAGESTYRSLEMLYMTIIGNVGDTFVGRKYYDDRGGVHTRSDPRRATRQSF